MVTAYQQAAATGSATRRQSVTGRRRWAALAVILAGTFMTLLDFFIVNVAIPSTQRDLHAGSGAIQFVVAGYGLAYAAGLITGGRLGDLIVLAIVVAVLIQLVPREDGRG